MKARAALAARGTQTQFLSSQIQDNEDLMTFLKITVSRTSSGCAFVTGKGRSCTAHPLATARLRLVGGRRHGTAGNQNPNQEVKMGLRLSQRAAGVGSMGSTSVVVIDCRKYNLVAISSKDAVPVE